MSTKVQRIKLVVSYDGTDFCGWAAQQGQRSVRSTLTEAVRRISGEENEIVGASRTDSGAHARGQVCHFDTACTIPPQRWADTISRLLPVDLAVLRSSAVAQTFHSRFSPLDRWYRYRILPQRRDPLRSRFVAPCWHRLDVDRMHRVAQKLVGTHDFRGFSEEMALDKSARRTILKIAVRARQDEVHIDVIGTAFIRGMMRRISGGLVEVGRGLRPEEQVSNLLDPRIRDSLQWPRVLPAQGLCLMRIRYGRPYYGQSQFIEEDNTGKDNE